MASLVIDANAVVSAIVTPEGTAARVLEAALRRYEIAQSAETMRELERVFERPHIASMTSARWRRRRIGEIRRAALFFRIEPGLPLSRDPGDDVYLHLAMAANSVAVVTGDRDLLILQEFSGIPILSPSRFLRVERSIRRGRRERGD